MKRIILLLLIFCSLLSSKILGRKKFLTNLILIFLLFFEFESGYTYFGAKFEPPDGRIIHGLGQYVSFFYSDYENWLYVQEYQNGINQIPVIYSVYAPIDPYAASLDSTDFYDIVYNHGSPYILLVGLVLHDTSFFSGQINIPVQSILSGSFDTQIIDIAQRIKVLNTPVYLRPGYEFGINNNGAHTDPDLSPTDFINIWYHIYDIFEQENMENVAWVWNTVNPQSFNYMEWYPGDDYVDWWGINYFTSGQINLSNGFLNDALSHHKPVMICESCPIQNGGTTNVSNWGDWFIPYFNIIKNNGNIKSFIYISDPWDKPGFFSQWPDSRITSNEIIRLNYQTEMQDSIYIEMVEYLNNPQIIGDFISPSSPNGLRITK